MAARPPVTSEVMNSVVVNSLFPPAQEECEIQIENTTGGRISKKKRADELNQKQVEIISGRSLLMSLMDAGLSAKAALQRVQLKRPLSISALQKLRTRYKKAGPAALKDARWSRDNDERVMTSGVKKLIFYYFLEIAGGPRAVWKEVISALERQREKGGVYIKPPSYSSVKKYISEFEEGIKLLKKGQAGIQEWNKQGAPVACFKTTRFANELWQADHCFLPI